MSQESIRIPAIHQSVLIEMGIMLKLIYHYF